MTQPETQQLRGADLLADVRARRDTARPQADYRRRVSKIERHGAAVLELRAAGATLEDIRFYLATLARPAVRVERSTILRYLRRIEPGKPG